MTKIQALDMVIDVAVDRQGRVNIPLRLREKYGIKAGDTLKLRATSSGKTWMIALVER